MSDYRFDFNMADATLDTMQTINGRVRQGLDDMQRRVESTLQDWTGDAQTAYWQAKTEWNRQADQMPGQLETGRQTLLNISDNYGTTEQRAAQIWRV
jgi:ESAT-6 family protein